MESYCGDDTLKIEKGAGDVYEVDICKNRSCNLKEIEWITYQACDAWVHLLCCDLKKAP